MAGLSIQDSKFCTESGRLENFSEVGTPRKARQTMIHGLIYLFTPFLFSMYTVGNNCEKQVTPVSNMLTSILTTELLPFQTLFPLRGFIQHWTHKYIKQACT